MAMNRRDFLKLAVRSSAVVAGSVLLPDFSFGYSAKAHTSLTELAIKLIRQSAHHSDFDHGELVAQIIKGLVEEDIPVTNCVKHYYNSDRPEGQRGLIFPEGFDKNELIQTPEQLKPLENLLATSIVNDGRWDALKRTEFLLQQALDYYRAGQLLEAYYTLGRACHPLEDAGTAEHPSLVNHAIIKIVTKDGTALDENLLRKLGPQLRPEHLDFSGCTYQIGSSYEKQCENIDLEKLLQGRKLEIIEGANPKELFDRLANESLHSEAITPLLLKHFWLGPTGNGTYINAQFEPEETETIYRHLAPKTIGSVAGLLRLWEKEVGQSKARQKQCLQRPAAFFMGPYFTPTDQNWSTSVYVLNKEGLFSLTGSVELACEPVFSEGDSFFYSLVQNGKSKICRYDLESGNIETVLSAEDGSSLIDLRLRKNFLAYIRRNKARTAIDLEVLDLSTKTVKPLTINGDFTTNNRLSCDGFIEDHLYSFVNKATVRYTYNLLTGEINPVYGVEKNLLFVGIIHENDSAVGDVFEKLEARGQRGNISDVFSNGQKCYALSYKEYRGRVWLELARMENQNETSQLLFSVEIDPDPSKKFKNRPSRYYSNVEIFGVRE